MTRVALTYEGEENYERSTEFYQRVYALCSPEATKESPQLSLLSSLEEASFGIARGWIVADQPMRAAQVLGEIWDVHLRCLPKDMRFKARWHEARSTLYAYLEQYEEAIQQTDMALQIAEANSLRGSTENLKAHKRNLQAALENAQSEHSSPAEVARASTSKKTLRRRKAAKSSRERQQTVLWATVGVSFLIVSAAFGFLGYKLLRDQRK